MIETSSTDLRIELAKKYDLASRLADMLKVSKDSPKISKIVLISIDRILAVSDYILDEDKNPRFCFELSGGLDIWEQLQLTPNVEIFSLSQKLLKDHYPDGEEIIQNPSNDMDGDVKISF